MRRCICCIGVRKVEEEEEEGITRKEQREEKHPDTYDVRFYCARCRSKLMWAVEFRDVGSSVVYETADCKHYEWVVMRHHPEFVEELIKMPDYVDWRILAEKQLLDRIKDRIAFVYTATNNHFLLLKKKQK